MITYFGIFDTLKDPHNLGVSPACCNKMEYVASCLGLADSKCEIVSIAEPISKITKYFRSKKVSLSQNVSTEFIGGFGGNGKIGKISSKVWNKFLLIWYFILHIRKRDTVVLYHTPRHIETFYLLKIILGFRLILEVEEVYDKVSKLLPYHKRLEQKMFRVADSFIFPTEVLDEQVNKHHKPSVIIYGNYKVNEHLTPKYQDGKIHVVYSGTFNARKGGAKAAIDSSEFLNEKYHLHLTGWGTDDEINKVKDLVVEASNKTNCIISYDGFVASSIFNNYLQKCHIGICSQNPDDILSTACFPSKILVYMSNGLSVVSSTTEPILRSKLSKYMKLYINQNGEDISKAIKECRIENDNRSVLKNYDLECINSVKLLVKEICREN